MKLEYLAPEIEVVKFTLKANILTASVFVTETPIEDDEDNIIDGDDDYDPFA